MLKTTKKLVGRHIRDEILGLHHLHQYKFDYQPEKSTETALHHVHHTYTGGSGKQGGTLGGFLYI
jgi:hypothetical protein